MEHRQSRLADFTHRHARQMVLIMVLLALGILISCLIVPPEQRAVTDHLIGFPDSDVLAQKARPYILAGICMIPALGALLYSFGDVLDRYICRRFLTMFGICLMALYVIWWLTSLADHMSDFRESHHALRTMGIFYSSTLPAVLLLLMPYVLLLSLLESLGKLSSNREITAMIQSGRGVVRITAPLIGAGFLCTLFCLGLNYHWAPVADGSQDEILALATGHKPTEATKVLYRNRQTERLWMVGAFPPDYEKGRPLIDVEVTTTNHQGQLVSRLSASHATWDKNTGKWTFDDALICHFRPGMPPVFHSFKKPLVIDNWSETPWQIIKPGLSAAYLGIPGLDAWLHTNELHPQMADASPYLTHWHYRLALPFACLVTILLATPLSIHFSRRGAGSGILMAVVLSGLMMLANSIILAFGESGHLPPMLAAWLPNILFGLLGIYLYHRRIHGRPIHHTLRKWLSSA